MPGSILQRGLRQQKRDSIRLTVPRDLQVIVQVQTADGGTWPARCLDLSLYGILLEFPQTKTPSISPDDKVLITIQFAKDLAKVHGITLHCKARRVGFSLPDGPGDRKLRDDQSLSSIFRNLERIILRKRQR